MAVNYEYYRCFYYVAKYQNLTLAAAAMMSSQPNVTRVMHNLEHELGCRLITRSNRGITLTEEGEILYRHVAVAFEQLRLGEETLSRSGDLQEGVIHLGASEITLHVMLLDVLRQFHQAYPAVRLKIHNFNTPQVLQALRNGQIDFAVIVAPLDTRQPFQFTPLRSFRDILIGGPQYQEMAKRELHLADLKEHPLISLARDSMTFSFYSRLYMKHGLELNPDIEVATANLILPMVENGLGLGFLPESLAQQALEAGRIVRLPLAETIPPRQICLVQDTHRGLSPAGRKLREMLLAQAEAFSC